MCLFTDSSAAIITAWLILVSSGLLRLALLVVLAGFVAGLTGLLWARPVPCFVPLRFLHPPACRCFFRGVCWIGMPCAPNNTLPIVLA